MLPSAVTISPVQRDTSKISVIPTTLQGTLERFGIGFSLTEPVIGRGFFGETHTKAPSLSFTHILETQFSSLDEKFFSLYDTFIKKRVNKYPYSISLQICFAMLFIRLIENLKQYLVH